MENETDNQYQEPSSAVVEFEGYEVEFDDKVKLIPVQLEDKS